MSIPSDVKVIEAPVDASGLRLGIVVARFNSFITDKLLDGAVAEILNHGGQASNIAIVRVPGSLELPLAARILAQNSEFDAIIALGAVIRGATSHYDLVCAESVAGLSRLSSELSIPVSFGVVTTDTVEQALERAGLKGANRGAEAALVALEMAQLVRALRK